MREHCIAVDLVSAEFRSRGATYRDSLRSPEMRQRGPTIPPLMTTPQREHWDGHPVELGDAWILRKGQDVARCVLVSHPLGWEVRLMTRDLLRCHVCRSSGEVLRRVRAMESGHG